MLTDLARKCSRQTYTADSAYGRRVSLLREGGHPPAHAPAPREGMTHNMAPQAGPHRHDFHPDSGWCAHCPTRDDGLALNYAGTVIRRPDPTPPLDFPDDPLT